MLNPIESESISLWNIGFYLAVRIRVQAFQASSTESNPKANPQREAFTEAVQHFEKKLQKGLGIVKLEKIHRKFFLDAEQETQLNNFLPSLIDHLGDHASGDEKLFTYSGRCPYQRKKHKTSVGIWYYTLCSKLSSGLPILLYSRPHTAIKSLGETVPTTDVVKDWIDVIHRLGIPKYTVLAFDAYYSTQATIELLHRHQVLFCGGLQKKRFNALSSRITVPSKPGTYSYLYNAGLNQIFVCAFEPKGSIGIKYSICNCFQPPGNDIPVHRLVPRDHVVSLNHRGSYIFRFCFRHLQICSN